MKKNSGLAWVLSLSMILYHRLCEARGVESFTMVKKNIIKNILCTLIKKQESRTGKFRVEWTKMQVSSEDKYMDEQTSTTS